MKLKRIGAMALSLAIVTSMLIPTAAPVSAAENDISAEELTVYEKPTGEEVTLPSGDEVSEEAERDYADNIIELEEEKADEEEPVREGQVLNGAQSPAEFSDEGLSVEGDDSVGQMLADKIGDHMAQQETNNGCYIQAVSMAGVTANVSFQTATAATLVVGLYSEDGKELKAYGKRPVGPKDTSAEVTITGSVPMYYYIKAYLVTASDQKPLCKVFESPEYTEDMVRLRNSTINSYDRSLVLNLDSDAGNNFLVFDAGVKQINEQADTNKFTDKGNSRYEIANPDDTAKGLKAGDIVSVHRSDNRVVIIKVSSINIGESIISMTGGNVSMEEAFDYAKIDSAASMDKTTVDNSHLDPGVTVVKTVNNTTYKGDEDLTGQYIEGEELTEEVPPEDEETLINGTEIQIDTSKSVTYNIDKKFGGDTAGVTLAGTVDFASAVKLKVELTPQNQYMELNIDYTAALRLSATGSLKGTLQLGKFIVAPIPGVFIEFTPSLVAELSAKFELNGTITGTIGIKVDGKSGISNTSKSPQLTGELKGEIVLFLGFSMEPEVAIICEQFADAGITALVGVEASAVLTTLDENSYGDKHLCGNLCVKGDLYGKMSLKANASFLNIKDLSFEYTMLDAKIKINDFYYSLKFKDFGWGQCPHFKDPFENTPVSSSDDFLFQEWKKRTADGTDRYVATIDAYKGNASVVLVPDTVTKQVYESGQLVMHTYEVTGIDGNPFRGSSVTAIKLPDTVVKVGISAFSECSNLKRIYLPDSISDIGGGVFSNCTSLNVVELPAGTRELNIGNMNRGFFQGCTSLKKAGLGEALNLIGPYAFKDCTALMDVDIPDSVKLIEMYAFYKCSSLKSVRIPGNTYRIGSYAFTDCKKLENVTFEKGLEKIERGAFSDCTALKEIRLPDGLKDIEENAFTGCSSVAKIYIPASVINTSSYSFDLKDTQEIYYGGSKKQFENLFGKYAAAKVKKVHYNSSSSDMDKQVKADVGYSAYNRDFTGLTPNTLYNFYCVKTNSTADLFADDNLLYIDQAVSDGNGKLSVSFTPRESVADAQYILREFESLVNHGKEVTGISLNKKEASLKVKKTVQLTAVISPADATDKSVTWSTSDKAVATVSSSGKVTAKAAGTAIITARTSNGKTATCTVKVSGIKLNSKILYVQKGKTSTAIKVTCTNDSVKSVVSGKKAVATAKMKGKKLQIKGIKPGKATITIKTKKGNTAKLTVNVQKGKVTTKKLKLSKSKVTLKKGKKATITVTATPDVISTGEKIKVSSSNKKIATAPLDKSTGEVTIAAKKKGSCKITVKAGKKKATIKVTVKK